MTKISRENIHCPALQAAYERAIKKAFEKGKMPSSDVYWPEKYGNAVSTKGTLEGSDVCLNCGKRIEVDLILKEINGVRNESEEAVKVYDELSYTESIKVSGTKCKI